jgi:hypothetical protein
MPAAQFAMGKFRIAQIAYCLLLIEYAPRLRPDVLGAGCFGRASRRPLVVLAALRRASRFALRECC